MIPAMLPPLLKRPVINDIATDPAQPPALAGADRPYPPSFAARQRAAYPDVKPLAVALSPEKTFALVAEVARGFEGWEALEIDGKGRMITGIAVSKVLRFKDDFVIIVQSDGGKAIVQMRSRSRVGRGDFGANATRIVAFLQRVAARVARG